MRAFTKAGDVAGTGGSQPTSYTMTLLWVGPHGLPQTFVAPTQPGTPLDMRKAAGDARPAIVG